jgi:hypothetical protein
MSERPCRPDADVKWLWQTLLPDTPLPTCGMANDEPPAIINDEPDRNAHAREQVARSWLRKFWPVKATV